MERRFPTKSQWGQFFKVLNKTEKSIFLSLILLAVSSVFVLASNFYIKNTEVVPTKGGEYVEGVVGFPRYINPIYAEASDVDRDLTELIYSGLMKYDENGNLVTDLAKEYRVLEEGRVYEFSLKEDLLWTDNEPLTADDIIFTIKTIQNPSFKSPLRASWLGVEVEKLSVLEISFELKNPSAVFLENITLKILPQHIWDDISYENFPLSFYNLEPVGSGPYKIKKLTKNKNGNIEYIESLELVSNLNYHGSIPNIPKVVFNFYASENSLIKAFNAGLINGLSLVSLENESFSKYHLSLPRYFAVFFNPEKSEMLAGKNIREALNYGTNKEKIVNEVLLNQGVVVNSPILPEIYGFAEPETAYEFDQEIARQLLEDEGFEAKENGLREKFVRNEASFQFKSNLQIGSQGTEVKELQKCLAKDPEVYPDGTVSGYYGNKTKTAAIKFQEKYRADILDPQGLKSGTGDVRSGTRKKLNEVCFPTIEETIPLAFTLTTVDQPLLIEVASNLKKQWKALGVDLTIETFDIPDLEGEVIKPRDYEMLLFGEVLGYIPDPFPFWHSSQLDDPGLNLTAFENNKADGLLEDARQTLDEKERKIALESFQELLIKDAPCVFLYSPNYVYLVSDEIKGIKEKTITNPSKRFSGIENWYIKTKRSW